MEKTYSSGARLIVETMEAKATQYPYLLVNSGGVKCELGGMRLNAVYCIASSREIKWSISIGTECESASREQVLEALDSLTVKVTGGTH